MTNLRFVLLATTALTAMQLASSASHAQVATPFVVAQAQPEAGPDGKPKQPPKELPKAPPPPAAHPAAPPPPA
ncbi:MAG: OmpA family protein, partial [Bradyrhizobium sp.]